MTTLALLAYLLTGGTPSPWSPDLLKDLHAWHFAPNEARVSVTESGLRIEVPIGRAWSIAALNDVAITENVGSVRARVNEVGGAGKWLVRLYGDLGETGKSTTLGVFQGMAETGEFIIKIDPRLLPAGKGKSLQLQLGLEGPPSASVTFKNLELLPGNPRPNRAQRGLAQPGQKTLPCVEMMPNLPEPFAMKDWRALAQAYDRIVFDTNAQGEYLPLAWIDTSLPSTSNAVFGMYSYVGDVRGGAGKGNQEGVTCLGAVLGASLAGIDKRTPPQDYVLMCEQWFNKRHGLNLVLNAFKPETGGSFWYEIWPSMVFFMIADRYPGAGDFEAIIRAVAECWLEAIGVMKKDGNVPNFDHTAFDFRGMRPVDNGKWKEPDAAAGVAWLEYMAWAKFREQKFLDAADACLRFLDGLRFNPYYEVLMPYGAYTAARMNAELGRTYDVDKMLNWCFGISDVRGGWGVLTGHWNGYDVDGLVGSIDNNGGYAFAMNTFAQAGALIPLVRYAPCYARAIGKWVLNAANSARLFYPDALPEDHQSSAFWKGDPSHVIAYEGLRQMERGKSPVATGDPLAMNWGPKTDLGLYGSSYVGMFSGIRTTDQPCVLDIDCRCTDFFRASGSRDAVPTRLIYNPYVEAKECEIDAGATPCRVRDIVSGKTLFDSVQGKLKVRIEGDSASVLTFEPIGEAAGT